MAMKRLTEVLTKKPFGRALPKGYQTGEITTDLSLSSYPEDKVFTK